MSRGIAGLFVGAGTVGAGKSQLGPSGGGVATPVVGPGGQDQDGGLIERTAPRITFAMRVAVLAAVLGAGAAAGLAGESRCCRAAAWPAASAWGRTGAGRCRSAVTPAPAARRTCRHAPR
jgi:hypothetical protein